MSAGTVAWAVERLRGLVGEDAAISRMAGFVHEGAPASKARARWSRKSGGFYTPRSTETEEVALSLRFRQAVQNDPFTGNVALLAIFYRPNHQRIDADNLLKLVLDAGTKSGAWDDDCQVTTQGAVVEYDKENPRTIVVFCDSRSTLDRSTARLSRPCEHCGKVYTPADATRARRQKFCSPACNARSRGQDLSAPVACPQCGVQFRRRTATQKFCSSMCSHASKRGRKRPDGSVALCVECGEVLARRTATRCRACWKTARSRAAA